MEHSKHIDEKTGREYLVKDRPVHIYDMIQEGREETLIENIVRKCQEGNEEVLDAIQGQYVDLTNHITSLMDAQNLVLKARNDFEELPLDMRKKFDNDVNVYMAEYGSETWNEKMGFNEKLDTVPVPVPEEKKGGEEVNE